MFHKKLWQRIRNLEKRFKAAIFGDKDEIFCSLSESLDEANKRIDLIDRHLNFDSIRSLGGLQPAARLDKIEQQTKKIEKLETTLSALLENFEEYDEIEGGAEFAFSTVKWEHGTEEKKIVTKYRLKKKK